MFCRIFLQALTYDHSFAWEQVFEHSPFCDINKTLGSESTYVVEVDGSGLTTVPLQQNFHFTLTNT